MSDRILLLLHVIFRHGDRTPDAILQYSNHQNDKAYYPYGMGQLTNIGKQSMYVLGQILRRHYDEFLGEMYVPGSLDAWSTEFERCKASLLLLLASLYPPKKELIWNSELKWLPVATNYLPIERDNVLLNILSPSYKTAYKGNFKKSYFGQNILKENAKLLSNLKENTGLPMETTFNVFMAYDTLKTQKNFGIELPNWAKKLDWDLLKQLTTYEFTRMMIDTTELKRLLAGNLLTKIIQDTQAKLEGKSSCNVHVYSVHDFNITSLLSVLGMIYPHLPGYGSCLVIEVYKTDSAYEIQVLYSPEMGKPFESKKFPDGQDYWTMEKFEGLLDVYGSNDSNFRYNSNMKERVGNVA